MIAVQIDFQRMLNYLLMALAVAGGIVFGALAGRLIDFSLKGEEAVLLPPSSRQVSVGPLREKDFQVILSRNLFNSAATAAAVEQIDLSNAPLKAGTTPEPAVGMGELRLVGTVVAGPDSLALIHDGKKAKVFRLGDELAPRVVVEEISRKVVVIDDHGQNRELPLLQGKENAATPLRKGTPANGQRDGIVPLTEGRWQVSKNLAAQARSNLNSLLQTARVVPEVRNGNTIGFKLVELKKGSLLEMIGLRVGDLIVEVNDVELNSPEKALQIFQQVRDANNISLGLIRNGQPQTFEYRLE